MQYVERWNFLLNALHGPVEPFIRAFKAQLLTTKCEGQDSPVIRRKEKSVPLCVWKALKKRPKAFRTSNRRQSSAYARETSGPKTVQAIM